VAEGGEEGREEEGTLGRHGGGAEVGSGGTSCPFLGYDGRGVLGRFVVFGGEMFTPPGRARFSARFGPDVDAHGPRVVAQTEVGGL